MTTGRRKRLPISIARRRRRLLSTDSPNMKYQIKDNFLDKESLMKIKTAFFSDTFPWYIQDGVSLPKKDSSCYLTHLLYNGCSTNSPFLNELTPLLTKLNIFALRRIKANFYPVTSEIVEHSYHVDYPTPHMGALFYLNSNNGSTILDDGTRIESIENRLLLFEAHVEHKSTTCTNDPIGRFNINFNYCGEQPWSS